MSYSVESSQTRHEGMQSTVVVERIRMPDGDIHEREVVRHAGAVGVVAIDDNGNIVLLRQYRHPFRTRLLEIPAGKLDVDGEEAEPAARRELLEETGLAADLWEELLTFANSAGWTDETTTLYLARGLRPADRPASFSAKAEEADLEVLHMPLADALWQAEHGQVPDAKTLIGILLAGRRLLS